MARLVVLASLFIVLVNGECQINGGPVDNCCCLGYNNNNYNVKSSGIYTISNFCGVKCSNARVYCDTTSGGGGWTVIMRRKDGSVDFTNRDWVEYEDGFGDLEGEFWLGLRSMNCLTNEGNWELRLDYQLANGTRSYLHYTRFAVGTFEEQYRLTVLGFNSAGLTDIFDEGIPLNGMRFSSRDRDHDMVSFNCEARHRGGWWYNDCTHLELNTIYSKLRLYLNGVNHYGVLFVEMKIRPQNCDMDNH